MFPYIFIKILSFIKVKLDMKRYIDNLLNDIALGRRLPKNYTYILLCADNSLYCGWTNSPIKRLEQHNLGKASKYTRARLPVSYAYIEEHEDRSSAMQREAYIKSLSRKQKEELIGG